MNFRTFRSFTHKCKRSHPILGHKQRLWKRDNYSNVSCRMKKSDREFLPTLTPPSSDCCSLRSLKRLSAFEGISHEVTQIPAWPPKKLLQYSLKRTRDKPYESFYYSLRTEDPFVQSGAAWTSNGRQLFEPQPPSICFDIAPPFIRKVSRTVDIHETPRQLKTLNKIRVLLNSELLLIPCRHVVVVRHRLQQQWIFASPVKPCGWTEIGAPSCWQESSSATFPVFEDSKATESICSLYNKL